MNIIDLLTDDKLYLFYRKSGMVSSIWVFALASLCCTCIVFGLIAPVIGLSLIPLYLSSKQIDQSNSSILSIHFHLYTHNLSLLGIDIATIIVSYGTYVKGASSLTIASITTIANSVSIFLFLEYVIYSSYTYS